MHRFRVPLNLVVISFLLAAPSHSTQRMLLVCAILNCFALLLSKVLASSLAREQASEQGVIPK